MAIYIKQQIIDVQFPQTSTQSLPTNKNTIFQFTEEASKSGARQEVQYNTMVCLGLSWQHYKNIPSTMRAIKIQERVWTMA